MNLSKVADIKDLLARHAGRAKRGLGQNFLVNEAVLDTITSAADLKKTDTVLEVGPGLGVLTQRLALLAKEVVCVEKDADMKDILSETVPDTNVSIIEGDILKLDVKKHLGNKPYKVVANIPYYITAPLIRFFLENPHPPTSLTLMVQKEVAQRICANPPKMSLLAISVQFYADAKIVSHVPKNNFWPVPKVDSAIIHITPKKIPDVDPARFFEVVKAGFSHPRKQLMGNFVNALDLPRDAVSAWLLNANIKTSQRAETLRMEDWILLTKNYSL